MNGAHNHILLVLRHLVGYIQLLFITIGANPLLLILETFNVIASGGALVADEEAALSAMMSPSKEVKSLLANLAVFLHLIRYPFRCR